MLSEVESGLEDGAMLAFTRIAFDLDGTVTSTMLHIKAVIIKNKTFI